MDSVSAQQTVMSQQPIEGSGEKTSIIVLLAYCVVIVLIFYLIYYAYQQFLSNRCTDGFVSGLEQERSDTVVDFDLHGEITQLENMQRNILNMLSSSTNL